ncbi:MAG TPA: hypothetical protein VM784_07585 [Actinomycetota bacterium]|nr:hypothetical protein [Actinomycetota bacterium]
MLLRVVASVIISLPIGAGVAFAVNQIVYGTPAGGSGSMAALVQFWGLLVGSVVVASVAGLLLNLRVGPRSRRKLFLTAALTLALLGLAAGYWILWWGVPPLTLEGAWLYPLAAFLLLAAGFLMWKGRPVGRGKGSHDATAPDVEENWQSYEGAASGQIGAARGRPPDEKNRGRRW